MTGVLRLILAELRGDRSRCFLADNRSAGVFVVIPHSPIQGFTVSAVDQNTKLSGMTQTDAVDDRSIRVRKSDKWLLRNIARRPAHNLAMDQQLRFARSALMLPGTVIRISFAGVVLMASSPLPLHRPCITLHVQLNCPTLFLLLSYPQHPHLRILG